ncbi:nucleotide disphospho-sugar-binding domain-containing protein [Streptomyces sp. NPDC048417]|uniref:nucleotide disphospho-sugar-binding domain-containing protein n=1 Tax=Streptomyces sp. NPDC048417 TaxID=3155387 RepID=UPI00341A98B4
MRVLFVAQGPSHVQWQIPLAWATQLAGHEVLVATRPPYVGQITRAGLPAVAFGDEERIGTLVGQVKDDFAERVRRRGAAEGGSGFTPTERELVAAGGRKMIAIAEGMADDAVAAARAWRPGVVVHDTGALVGQVVAAALGVPALGHTWGATVDGVFDLADEQFRPHFDPLFHRFGARPLPMEDTVWIDPSPPSMRAPVPVRRIDMRYVPYSGPGVLPDWLWAEHRPRVCVTTGISGASPSAPWGEEAHRALLESLAGQGCEVVLTVRDASRVAAGTLPEGVRVVESFPLNVLLPTCAAVVHHGGVGTGTTSLACGVPQLVLAGHLVQRRWGEQVAAAGAGLTLPADGTADAPQVAKAAAQLLADPALREGARRVAAEIAAMPAPSVVVGMLADAASASSSGPPVHFHAVGPALRSST